MAGAMRKVGEYLGLVEQADFDDDFDDEPSMPVPVKRERDPERRPAVVRPTTVSNIEEHRRPRSTASEASSDLYRIETVTPRTYNDARTVGEHYRAPSDSDLKITSLLAIEVEELNGKRRTGPPAGPADSDDSPDAFGTRGIVPVSPSGEVGPVE